MKKHRKKIITGIIFLTILIGIFGVVTFSPKIADMFQKAVAQNEGEGDMEISSDEVGSTEENITEVNENILTLEDTNYAVAVGANEEYKKVSEVDSLTVGGNYRIETVNDWVKLQEFSQSSSLAGVTFHIYYPNNSSTAIAWNLTSTELGTGIGSETFPFAGKIIPYYDGMTIHTTATLFHTLSSNAVIGKTGNNPLTIENAVTGSTDDAGGLAKTFVIEDTEVNLGTNLINLNITGTIQSTGTVGGLFGKVVKLESLNVTPSITLSKDSGMNLSGVTSLTGSIAGGLFGEVSGIINMKLESMPSVASKVMADGTNYNNTETPLQLTVCAGGLIGKMSGGSSLTRTVSEDAPEYLIIGNEVGSEGISGGLVGAVDESNVNVSYIQKDSVLVDKVEPYIYAKYICGGFIGVVQSSDVNQSSKVTLDHLKLNADVKAYSNERVYTSAGGVIGKYITESEDKTSFLTISYITTGNTERVDKKGNNNYTQTVMVYAGSNDSRMNTCGGIIGSCNGNGLTVQNIDFSPYMGDASSYTEKDVYNVSLIYAVLKDYSYMDSVSNTSNESVTGGIAGSLCGLNLVISDTNFNFVCNPASKTDGTLSNSLGGNYVGNITGLVGYDQGKNIPTKMKVTDIEIENNYIHKAKKYHGGLFGYVGKGAIICLDDTDKNMDISKVPFQFQWNYSSRDFSPNDCYMLAPDFYYGYRGFIAGYSEESLIYFETDTTVTRSIKMDEGSGNLISNMQGINFDSDNGTYYQYCIDDIGNAGSVFQNIESSEGSESSVIVYSNSYGSEVTGTLKITDGKYEISSLADALILAIAGQAYDPETGNLYFAANCFTDENSDGNVTITEVLSAHYIITTSLDLGEANIMSFLRGDSAFKFTGTMEGKVSDNKCPVITLDSISKQINGGLYSYISGASFENLTIDGNLWYHKGTYNTTTKKSEGGSGSIAAKAEGNCIFDGITVNTSIKGDLYSSLNEDNGVFNSSGIVSDRMYSHGGLIGTYQLVGGNTLTVTNCTFQSEITTIRSSNFVGGMIGRVDTSLGDGNSTGSINVSDSNLSATITADATNYAIGLSSSPKNKIHARTAGLIAFIGNSYENMSGINSSYNGYPIRTVEDKTYANISLSNILIQDTTIDLSKANNAYVNMSGGLLGYGWCNVEATMDDITVDGCNIQSLGSVGGLITFIAGKFDVNSVNLSDLTMNCVDGDRPFSGLLFGNGQVAYVTLKQDKYIIDTSTGDDGTENGIKISGYSSFDEIMGINVKINLKVQDNATFFQQEIDEKYQYGGILNIINDNFSNFTSDSYESYTNKVCTTSNKYTRYYYNLFQGEGWELTDFGNSITIDTPKELMIWHIGSYVDERLIRFFAPYFNGNSYYRSKLIYVTITGKLDMTGYSLYPTCMDNVKVTGTNNAKIILYGEEISDLEYGLYNTKNSKVYRNNELKGVHTEVQSTKEYTQHYLMHSSLLYNVNNAEISGLTISGSIANNASNTGSLIGGYVTGNVKISNIVFEGLRVSHYASLSGEYSVCGLMLGNVGFKNYTDYTSNVVIDNIKTSGYESVPSNPVAGALIARVGSSSAKNIQISFKNMNLDSEKSSNVFQYAAFMYSFNYSSDSKDNKSYGIYTFDYADTVNVVGTNNEGDNHNVTYGQEISEGIHYNDYYLYEIEAKSDYANPLKDAIEAAKTPAYVPYVYENMGIFVNPKNGNITEGCGTYEDPYIIENPAQLLTLFCYLSGEHDVYRSFLKPGEKSEAAWKVVPIGGDGDGYECIHNENETTHTAVAYENDGFPTVDDMRTAYYMIKNDIDLANTGDANYTMLLKRFAGLGSYKYPFSGVIVGAKITETTYPTITLPSNDSTDYTHFGLIEYMQGAVVKDINIKSKNVTITDSVGGVAAVILGGDNIIDNVTVGISATLRNAPAAGGYVGIIENGSLILRNVKDKNVASGCEFNHYNDEAITVFYTSPGAENTLTADENMKVGLLVGKVEDGFILYDNAGEFSTDKKVITITDMPVTSRTEVIPLVNGFHIINGYSLDAASGAYSDRIALETQKSDDILTGFDINIYNTEQLEIMALALNSDSLSVYVDESHSNPELRVSHESGYDYTAKCRKAAYSDIGTDSAKNGNSDDCKFAKAYDDGRAGGTSGYLYPYLCYKYMCVTDYNYDKVYNKYTDAERFERFKTTISLTEGDAVSKYISVLNKADDNVKGYTTSYKLRAYKEDVNYVYDLSVYENSFRGFGALYSKTYSDFRANFDGRTCFIKIKMDRNWDPDVAITGMFNSLVYDNRNADGTGKELVIEDFKIIDSVFQNILNKEDLSTVDETNKQQGAVCGAATGAVAGEVQGKWDIKDITFERTGNSTSQTSYEALLLAALNDEEFDREITCGVRGYMNVGGLIGRINVTEIATDYGKKDVHDASNEIGIKRCFVQGVDETNRVNIIGGTNAFAVGGLVGSVGANVNSYGYDSTSTEKRYFYFGEVLFEDCTVKNVNVLAKNSGFLGGFAGTVGYNAGVYCRTVGRVKVEHDNYNEGYTNTIDQVKILSTVYENRDVALDKYSAGGVFGQIEVLAYKPLAKASDGKTYRNSDISSEAEFSNIQDVTVNNVIICNQSDNTYTNTYGNESYTLNGRTGGIGGLIGYLNCRKMVIENIQVKGATIGFNDFDDEDNTNDQFARTHVGGLIGLSSSNGEYSTSGMSFYTNMLKIGGASVTDSKIVNYQKQADAGGFIGYLSTEIVTMEVYKEKEGDVVIKTINNTISNNEISASGESANAGGVIGRNCTTKYVPTFDYTNSSLEAKKYIKNMDVENNLVTAMGSLGDAGGIVGEFTINDGKAYDNRLTLENVNVGVTKAEGKSSSNTIIGTEYVGGLCGYIKGMTYLRYHGDVKVGSEAGGNTLIGRVTGGLYGKNEVWMTGELKEVFDDDTESVEIVNNKIIATSHNVDATVSGGVAGVRDYDLSTSPNTATYTIKKNVIVATGRTATGNINSISCGGMYGIVRYTNGPYIQYFDDIVLENNSIGYYPAYQKGLTGYDKVVEYFTDANQGGYILDYTSQEVCLLKWNTDGTRTYGNWRTFEINESNVGDYSCGIGSYIGEYKDISMHCVFLKPSLSYSDEVGSIPAVDVASHTYNQTVPSSDYGYSYPYDYKKRCHFIYLDDYLSEDVILDITNTSSGVKPILDESVLMVHDTTSTTINDETITINTYETDYYFGNIADIVSRYSEVKNTTLRANATTDEKITATYNFLASKRLDITMGGTENENLICASPDGDDYFSMTYIPASQESYNGVSVIEMDGQAAQYIGDYVAAILTNGGGVYPEYSSNTFNNILNISCVNAYIDPSGTIYALDINDESIPDVIKNTDHTESSITVVEGEKNQLSAVGRPFDQVIEAENGDKYYTITLLRYTYISKDYKGKEKKETIYIPVFVTKKVTMNSYLSILSGEEYSLEEATTNGWKDGVVISHDSVYTVYSEFVYDNVREEEAFSNLKINKTLKFESKGTNGYQAFNVQPGTKYTLVDVQTGKEYYYTVPENASVSEIPFSEFKDGNGGKYIQRKIGTDITIEKDSYTSIAYQGDEGSEDIFTDVGLERFVIVVEPSGADNNVNYRLSIETEVVDENDDPKEESVRKIETEGTNITQIPGPLISFEGVYTNNEGVLTGTDDVTEITGAISKDNKLEIDGRIRVSLTPPNNTDSNRTASPYWRNKNTGNTIDSANSGKYLEIGVTLIDDSGQEVQWPEGTNVSINGGPQKPLQGNSVIYAYKDNEEQFAFDTLTHNIANGEWYYYDIFESEIEENKNYQWITKDNDGKWYYQTYVDSNLIETYLGVDFKFDEKYVLVSNQCRLEFDFSVADIKDYVGKDFTVKINLYRSSDPDFPLEEVGTAVLDGSIREYFKKISAEGNVDLAAAITPNDLLELGINFYGDTQDTYEISFTNKIDFTNMISTNETAAENDVKECAEKKYMVVYRIYKKTPNSEGNGYTYELVDLHTNDLPFSLTDSTNPNTTIQISKISGSEVDENENAITEYAFVTTKMFTEQEISSNTADSPQYVVTWQMKLTVDSSNITNEDLANYKVEATYLPYEGDQPTSDSESTLKDYFIFTIAKLKTDF